MPAVWSLEMRNVAEHGRPLPMEATKSFTAKADVALGLDALLIAPPPP